MALRSLEARPVTVMQPEMMPATPQATATVMEPLAPPSRELKIMAPRSPRERCMPIPALGLLCTPSRMMSGRLTTMVATMASAAEYAMV